MTRQDWVNMFILLALLANSIGNFQRTARIKKLQEAIITIQSLTINLAKSEKVPE